MSTKSVREMKMMPLYVHAKTEWKGALVSRNKEMFLSGIYNHL